MKAKRGMALILGGLLLIAAALCLTAYNLWDNKRVERRSAEALAVLSAGLPRTEPAGESVQQQREAERTHHGTEREERTGEGTVPGYSDPERILADYELNPDIPMPETLVDGYTYIALLRIPALNLELPVMGDWDYERLRSAPCRYVGSIYTDNLVIMAHNYDSHFGRLYRLGVGDEVSLTDMHGNVFHYRVTEQEVLDGDDAEPIITGDWDLTLFTCTVGGLSRVTLRCERI